VKTIIIILLSYSSLFAQKFASIGDYGDAGANELAVANLVNSWNPDFIITLGDNNYPDGADSTIDENIGQYYDQYIYPYVGSYGSGSPDVNRFFPSLGNHDWNTNPPQPYYDYFVLPNNERYYDFVWGDVHFFVLNSDTHEPDGVSETSVQGQWLQNALSTSTSIWRVVYFHNAPYSSSSNHGSQEYMQWPFKDWGADVVMSGHDHTYERLIIDGFPYFVNGLGGRSKYNFGTPIPGSQVRYSDKYGAMLMTANETQLTFSFFSVDSELIDYYEIIRPNAPTNLVSTVVSELQIDLSWADSSDNEDGFRIERKLGPGGLYTEIATVGANVTTYQDTALTTNTQYCYRVRAYNTGGNSGYSNEDCATTYPQTVVDPILTLNAPGIVDQDDMCIWIHQNDKSLSTIITSDKGADKLFVYDLSGNVLQTIDVPGQPGNIDIRYNFMMSGVPTDIVGYNDRSNGTIVFYKVDRTTRQLSFVSNFSDGGMTGNNYGFCLYRSLLTEKYYAIASSNSTQMKQWELVDNGDGTIGGTFKRTWSNGTGDITEGLVADDELGILYAANEGEGIYKYNAEPNDPNPIGELIAPTGVNGLTADVEGITIYYTAGGNGYLLASSQGSSNFKVYERQAPHNFIKTVQVTGVGSTDGIDVTNLSLGPSFPLGLFLTHDGTGSPYVIRGSKWEDLGLAIDTTYWDPTNFILSPGNLTAEATGVNEVTLGWTDNSNNEDGFIIERENSTLPDFAVLDSVNANVTSYIDSSVSQGVSYNYRVRAFNISGQSGYSNVYYVTTILPGPTNLVGQLFGGPPLSVVLNWQESSGNELGFVIERDTEGTGNYESLDSVAADITTYEDTNFVNPVDTLYYRVYAYSQDTVSEYSNIAEMIIPVELVSFTAEIFKSKVTISWRTATEANNLGFEVQRKLENSEWKRIGFVEGHGTTTEGQNYKYIDEIIGIQARTVGYRLKQVNYDGSYEYSAVVEVTNPAPTEFVLEQNYPNPFNPSTKIRYEIPGQADKKLVVLKLYDVIGNEIATLENEEKEAGRYEAELNATNLPSGIYFYRLSAGSFTETKKMILLK